MKLDTNYLKLCEISDSIAKSRDASFIHDIITIDYAEILRSEDPPYLSTHTVHSYNAEDSVRAMIDEIGSYRWRRRQGNISI